MKYKFWVLVHIGLAFVTACSGQHQTLSPNVEPSLTAPLEPAEPVEDPALAPTKAAWLTGKSIPLPPENHLYHGVFPSGGDTVVVSLEALREYEFAAGKQAAWIYFSHFWFDGKEFPLETALWIRSENSIPYLRLMMQSFFKSRGDEPLYTLQNIIEGQFDSDLRAWCQSARDFGTPLIAEYGTEVNSDSFPWSGIYNGGGQTGGYGDPNLPDGPERFRDAYRHIIQLCRNAGADNITWVFHAGGISYPDEAWNAFENFFPGAEWIDWLGFSAYGTHTPFSSYYRSFRAEIEDTYPRMIKMAPDKPIIVAELGSAKNNPYLDQVEWSREALEIIVSMQYKNLIGFTWWNEAWQNDSNPENDTTMRVQDNPELQALFREMIGNNPAVLGEISN